MPEPTPIYFEDLIDPRRRVSLFYFSPLVLFFAASVLLIYIAVPALFIAFVSHFYGYTPAAEETAAFANVGYLICGSLFAHFVLVVCLNRLRAAGLNL